MNTPYFNQDDLKFKIKTLLSEFDDFMVLNNISDEEIPQPSSRYLILLTTSILRAKLLTNEIIFLVDNKRFFPAVATLRMLFEEMTMLTYTLFQLLHPDASAPFSDLVLQIIIGRKSGREEHRTNTTQLPINIRKMNKTAEKYFRDTFHDDKSTMLEQVYDFLSEYIHPNAPSHYYFWQSDHGKTKFILRTAPSESDLGFVLNYTAMTLNLYKISYKQLEAKNPYNNTIK